MKSARAIVLLNLVYIAFIIAEIHASTEQRSEKLESPRKITVALSERIPFVIVHRNGTPSGLEVLIIENFARKFQFRINYLIVNSSLNYIFATKKNHRDFTNEKFFRDIDLLMGGLDENTLTKKHFNASQPYYHDVLTWCVREKQAIPIWKNIFHLCTDWTVWTVFTIMTFIAIFMMYFLQSFEDGTKWDWFRLTLVGTCTIFGTTSTYKPQLNANRMFYIFGHLGSIVFGVTLIAFFIKFLTAPIYMNQISSIEELVNGSFNMVGDRFALQLLKRQDTVYPIELLDKFKACADLDVCLSQLHNNSKLAVAISHEHSINSRLIKGLQPYCFENTDIIYEYALKFLIRKDFPYVEELNEFIRMASAGGLINKWRKDSQIRHHYKEKPQMYFQITMDNYYGTHLIWIGLQLAAILTLFLEILIYKKVTEPNPSRLWVSIEMIIDPIRHFWLENRWA